MYLLGYDLGTSSVKAAILDAATGRCVAVDNGMLGSIDAKTRRNSTDPEDIFIAHIAGMDAMARALLSAADVLEKSPYRQMLADRYASFDSGKDKEFEEGRLSLEQLVDYAHTA